LRIFFSLLCLYLVLYMDRAHKPRMLACLVLAQYVVVEGQIMCRKSVRFKWEWLVDAVDTVDIQAYVPTRENY